MRRILNEILDLTGRKANIEEICYFCRVYANIIIITNIFLCQHVYNFLKYNYLQHFIIVFNSVQISVQFILKDQDVTIWDNPLLPLRCPTWSCRRLSDAPHVCTFLCSCTVGGIIIWRCGEAYPVSRPPSFRKISMGSNNYFPYCKLYISLYLSTKSYYQSCVVWQHLNPALIIIVSEQSVNNLPLDR